MTIIKKIKSQILNSPILIYMKGSPENPQCGFSARAVQALSLCVNNFDYVDVLINPEIRKELPKYSKWPTFPQLWVNKNLIGGSDIIIELLKNGKLKKILKSATLK
ncbi:Grx4 family monothiol glutaredoxin [Buchnera aphidicola]|uniref:Grx4 family monothiol glutaredoxin n=1 Tax=Buchnera aphidicola TaxID=9 RepID=UPI0030EE529F